MDDETVADTPSQAQIISLRSSAAEDEIFGYGVFVAPQDAVLFPKSEIPAFRLDATRELLDQLGSQTGQSGDVFRVVVSEKARDALTRGLAELTPAQMGGHHAQIRDQSTGRFLENARLVEAAVPFASTPQGMAALLAVAAVTELALVLQQAFEVIHQELLLIRARLKADHQSKLFEDLAKAQSAMSAAQLAESMLRESGDISSSAGLSSHSHVVDAVWHHYRNLFGGWEASARPFLNAKDPRADEYLKTLKDLFPYDVFGMRGAVVVFAAACVAKLHVDSVKRAEAQLKLGRIQPVSAHLDEEARSVRLAARQVADFVRELARRDFRSDLKPQGKKPISGGFLSKMPVAMTQQRRLRDLEDLTRDLLDEERFQVVGQEWVEMELHKDGDTVMAKAVAHRDVARVIRGGSEAPKARR